MHALLIVGITKKIEGYESEKSEDYYFIARNSYGTNWGLKGHCYIPKSSISRKFTQELWVVANRKTFKKVCKDLEKYVIEGSTVI